MVMSKKNMKRKLFGSVYKKWLKEEEPWLYIYDAFNKEIDSLKIIPNEYGSVSDSFRIPKTASTGEWSIEPDYIDVDWNVNTGSFMVEEYKRPSYEITVEEPKKELLPGDTILFKVKVRSFAGSVLNNVRVNYAVARNGKLPLVNVPEDQLFYQENTLLDTVGYTDTNGELNIAVNDLALKNTVLDKTKSYQLEYSVTAEAIDATGESYEANRSVTISTRPVSISIPVADKNNRTDLQSLLIKATDRNAGTVSKKIDIEIFLLEKKEKPFRNRRLVEADVWLYDKADLQEMFPDLDIMHKEVKEVRSLVLSTTINTGENEKLKLDPGIFVAGNYEIEATVTEDGLILGETKRRFEVFDEKEDKLPVDTWNFYHFSYNSAMAGDTLKYFYGNSEQEMYSVFHVTYFNGGKKIGIRYYYDENLGRKGLNRYDFKVPSNSVDKMNFMHVYILNNQLFKHEEIVYLNGASVAEPEIVIEKYRKKLLPGGKETFVVSVKTKNENIAAELMTTMYDASLDKLQKHEWRSPENRRNGNRYINLRWTNEINGNIRGTNYEIYPFGEESFIQQGHSLGPLWWMNPVDNYYGDVMGDWNLPELLKRMPGVQNDMNPDARFGLGLQNLLEGRVAGLDIGNAGYLNEVVVTALGVRKLSAGAGSATSIRLRGVASLSSYSQPLIILDGVPYEGDITKIDPATIFQGLVLKGADATAIYGSRAAEGVLILSTKGEIILPKEPEPVIAPRKNFSETAFFFPIHSCRQGRLLFFQFYDTRKCNRMELENVGPHKKCTVRLCREKNLYATAADGST